MKTPLHYAAKNGHVACVRELLTRGAAVGATDRTGQTSLHAAARYGHSDCITALLDADAASINLTERQSGRTALHFAAAFGHIAAVEALLAYAHCDTSIGDFQDETAAEVARSSRQAAIVELIEARDNGKSSPHPTSI